MSAVSSLLIEALEFIHARMRSGCTLRDAARGAARMYRLDARQLVRYWRNEP